MVWNRRLFQNVSDCLLLFQFTENAESHGQHRQQHPQVQHLPIAAKIHIDQKAPKKGYLTGYTLSGSSVVS